MKLTEDEKYLTDTVRANWSKLSVPGQLLDIINRLLNADPDPPPRRRPCRGEREIPTIKTL